MYDQLKQRLDQLDHERGANGNRLFYLATPPSYYGTSSAILGETGLVQRQEI